MLRAASIRSQLLALIGLAVLPAVLLSAGLTWHAYKSTKNAGDSYQRQTALNIASQIRGVVTGANAVAYTLLNNQSADGPEKFCATLGVYIDIDPRTLTYGYYSGGKLVCAAGEASALAGFSPDQIAAAGNLAYQNSGNRAGRLQTVLASATNPHYLAAVSYKGDSEFIVSVLSPAHLREILVGTPAGRSNYFAILNTDFEPIAQNSDAADSNWLPAKDKSFLAARFSPTKGQGLNGREYSYISSPIEEGVASILSAVPEAQFGQAEQQLIIGIAVPLMIFAIVMAVAWMAIDRLFLQWMKRLSRTAHRLSFGDFNVRAALPEDAPLELRQYADAFDQMTEVLATRTHELATVANQRSALLRELHHRVKNNFQVIASFINLTKRQKTGEAYESLALTECRVHAMATAYKLALAHGDISLAPLGPLVSEVLAYIQQAAKAPSSIIVNIQSSDDPAEQQFLELDRAIPLSLLLVEVTWPLLGATPTQRARTRVMVMQDGERAKILVYDVLGDENTESLGPDQHGKRKDALMSERLRAAFINQIDGEPIDEAEIQALEGSVAPVRTAAGSQRFDHRDGPDATRAWRDKRPTGKLILAISIPAARESSGG